MVRVQQVAIGGGVNLNCREQGAPDNPKVLVCVHGLTRNACDFDRLGAALADAYRVIAVDMVGRGDSSWLADGAGYQIPNYVMHCMALLDALGLRRVDWLGTSMGGFVGMGLAAAAPDRIGKLLLNDVGPFLDKAVVADIWRLAADWPIFDDLDAATAYFRTRHSGFGPIDDAGWRALAASSIAPVSDRDPRLQMKIDPAIVRTPAQPSPETPPGDVILWDYWAKISAPTLVLRGTESTVLTRATALGMRATRPDSVTVCEFSGVGHAPSLMVPDQIAAVRDWLL